MVYEKEDEEFGCIECEEGKVLYEGTCVENCPENMTLRVQSFNKGSQLTFHRRYFCKEYAGNCKIEVPVHNLNEVSTKEVCQQCSENFFATILRNMSTPYYLKENIFEFYGGLNFGLTTYPGLKCQEVTEEV